MRVYDILMEKIEQIQSRLPVRINIPRRTFNKVLQNSMDMAENAAGTTADDTMANIEACIKEASAKYGIDSSLIRAVIKYESGFDPNAVSRAGAQGLMQVMPETAKLVGIKDPFDIRQNIMGGTSFLRNMLNAFDGNLELALAAYNAGPTVVRSYNGVPPYEETRKYIENVLKDYGADKVPGY